MFQEIGEIIENQRIMPDIYKITVKALKIAQKARPGQFVMVLCQDEKTFLRRPFSIASVNPLEMKITLLFKVVGPGTEWLAQLKFDDTLDILGPLGNGYNLTGIDGKKILLVAGGIGIASLISIAEKLYWDEVIKTNLAGIHILFGAKTLEFDSKNYNESIKELFFLVYRDEFIFTTEDGSYGHKGLVTDVLADVIKQRGIEQIFACGPKAMLKKVAEISQALDIPCQVSLEEKMACGVGACLSCACRVGETYKRVCKDGPVFEAKEVNWS